MINKEEEDLIALEEEIPSLPEEELLPIAEEKQSRSYLG